MSRRVPLEPKVRSNLAAALRGHHDGSCDDADVLVDRYLLLTDAVNGSPPIIQTGDARICNVAGLGCPKCQSVVGAIDVIETRLGPVYVAWTQRPNDLPTGAWRQIPVVLSRPEAAPTSRFPLLRGDLKSICRQHGKLSYSSKRVLKAAQAGYSDFRSGNALSGVRRVFGHA